MRAKSSGVQPVSKVFGTPPKKAPRPSGSGIRPGLFYLSFAALFGTNVLTLVGFLMAPDISALLGGQNDVVVAAYEDRIAQLRVEVDRLHSRQFAQTGDINLQLQELTQQQEVLLEQHQLVKQLAQKAAELGIDTTGPAAAEDVPGPVAAMVTPASTSAAGNLAEVSASMTRMMGDSRMALAALSESATELTDTILDELGGLGIKPNMPDGLEPAVGGPFCRPSIPATQSGSSTTPTTSTWRSPASRRRAVPLISLLSTSRWGRCPASVRASATAKTHSPAAAPSMPAWIFRLPGAPQCSARGTAR